MLKTKVRRKRLGFKNYLGKTTNVCDLGDDIKKFIVKSVSIALVMFFTVSILPSYAVSHDIEEYDFDAFFEDTNDYVTKKLPTTNNGFLLNTSGVSLKGDRSDMTEPVKYLVKSGDNLSKIAQKFDLKMSTIAWANNISTTDTLPVGKSLVILPVDGVLHKVQKGENISKIVKKYNAKKDLVIAQNKLSDQGIKEGDEIIIPGGRKQISRDYVAVNRSRSISSVSNATPGSYMNIPDAITNSGSFRLVKPARGKITQGYRRGHYAIDIANSSKGDIYAAFGGTVVKAAYGWNGGYGNYIVIDHGNNRQTLYAHNEKLYVSVGDIVSQGQPISYMGNTGRVYGKTGIHLHFEVIVNGVKKNPFNYF